MGQKVELDLKSVKSMKTNKSMPLLETQSVFTLNPDEKSANIKMFHVKNFEGNDGTKFELVEDGNADNDVVKSEEIDGVDGIDRKRKKKKRKRDDEDLKYIQSLDKKEQRRLLKEIEKRERKRKRKHNRKASTRKRSRSRERSSRSKRIQGSRSRSRSNDLRS